MSPPAPAIPDGFAEIPEALAMVFCAAADSACWDSTGRVINVTRITASKLAVFMEMTSIFCRSSAVADHAEAVTHALMPGKCNGCTEFYTLNCL
jgi:hypothetical protein